MEKIKQQIQNGEAVTEDQVRQVANKVQEDLVNDITALFDKYTEEYNLDITTTDNGITGWNIGEWLGDLKDMVLSKLEDEFANG